MAMITGTLFTSFDEDSFGQELADGALYRGKAQLGMPRHGVLGTPDPRAVIARLVGQIHGDLLPRRAAELTAVAKTFDVVAHRHAPSENDECESPIPVCTGIVSD